MKQAILAIGLASIGLAAAQPAPADDDLDVPAAPPSSTEPAPPPPPVTPVAPPPNVPAAKPDAPYALTGYIQSQYQHDQLSQDQLSPSGAQLNRDQFLVRRARVTLAKSWEYAAFAFELDANTVRGADVGLRRAEAALTSEYASLIVGLSDIPFGRELTESSRERFFAERTTGSTALFPGEPDLGARIEGRWRYFRYALAALNGEPISEPAGINRPDPNGAKDFLFRGGVDLTPRDDLHVAANVSMLGGTGFHAGTAATKDGLQWVDSNENGVVDLGEVVSVPGVAATPSQNFKRWGLGADARGELRTCLGLTRVAAEITVASNLDRGLAIADPIVLGRDVRELAAEVHVVQDLGPYAFVGLRFDYYDPDLDALDARRGAVVPTDASITTLSPIAGFRAWRARVTLEYDIVADSLARDTRGVPTDVANDRFIARLQVDL